MLEAELGPHLAQARDGHLPLDRVLVDVTFLRVVQRRRLAHRDPDATRQLLDRRAGQQDAQAESAPSWGEPHGRKDEDAAPVWLELVVQGGVELAGGRVEDGFGDPAKVGVLAV